MAKKSMRRKRTPIRRQRKTPQSKRRFGRRKFYKRKSRFSRKARTRNRGRKSLSGGSGIEGGTDGSGLVAQLLPEEAVDEIINKHLDSVLKYATLGDIEKKENVKAKIMKELKKSHPAGEWVNYINQNIEDLTQAAIDGVKREESEEKKMRYGGTNKMENTILEMIARENWMEAIRGLKGLPDGSFAQSITAKLKEEFNSQIKEALAEAPQTHANAISSLKPENLTISQWLDKKVAIHYIDPDVSWDDYLLSSGKRQVARIGSLKDRFQTFLIDYADDDVLMKDFTVEGLPEALLQKVPKESTAVKRKLWRRLYIELSDTLGLEALPSDNQIVKGRVGEQFAGGTISSFSYKE